MQQRSLFPEGSWNKPRPTDLRLFQLPTNEWALRGNTKTGTVDQEAPYNTLADPPQALEIPHFPPS